MNNCDCPNTEMHTHRAAFEAAHNGDKHVNDNQHLNLTMRKDAPHYDSKATRIAYSVWEKAK